jgi:putative heme iron utilization protein
VTKDVLRPVDAQARALAKRLLRSGLRAALASSEPGTGWPYASLVTLASTLGGAPLLLLSDLALHAASLRHDPRCSLLFDASGAGDPLAHPRLTVFGEARFLERGSDEASRARRRFLARHPKSSLYADFGDFNFVRVEPRRAFLNAGFGRASELVADDFMTPVTDPLQPLQDTEASAIDHMNADHADAVRLIATRLAGGADGPWELIGLDPDGIDLRLDGTILRYAYDEPLATADALRARLVALTRLARERTEG